MAARLKTALWAKTLSPFLVGITWPLLFQCAGESVTQLFGLPIPGPVVAMLSLFVALRSLGRVFESLSVLCLRALASCCTSLGSPRSGFRLKVALLGSTVLTIAATALTFSAPTKRRQRDREELPSAEL
jgi:holin-like protein